MKDVLGHLEAGKERRLAELKELLSIPSVSAQPAFAGDCKRAAEWIAAKAKAIGLENARVNATKGHPVVTAEWRGAPGAPTILVYGHYDVQPPEPLELWTTPPFEPTVRDGRIYARGATDDKGQMLLHLHALEAFLATRGKLPVNVVLLLEGEEEVASAHLDQFIREHKEMLAADAAVISDTAMWDERTPALVYGLRGICTFDVVVEGAKSDLHSGIYGGAIMNPAEALARMVSKVKDERGRVAIPGFYDGVKPVSPAEKRAWRSLKHSDATFKKDAGVTALHGEPGKTTLERLWARPTLEINGITGGYQGDGFKTVLPAKASAKVSCRLVPDQDPAAVNKLVVEAFRRAAPPGVKVTVTPLHSGRPELIPLEERALQVASMAIEETFGKAPVFIREGGSIPVVSTLRQRLKVPVVLMGFGLHDENLHAPDEFFRLRNFDRGVEACARFYGLAAGLKEPSRPPAR